MLRIGRIPYLNCEPFFTHLTGVELVSHTPRALGQAMAEGGLDAAPLSLVDALRLEAMLVPLPFGIATPGPARSGSSSPTARRRAWTAP
jgi:predicted solute-binding protein